MRKHLTYAGTAALLTLGLACMMAGSAQARWASGTCSATTHCYATSHLYGPSELTGVVANKPLVSYVGEWENGSFKSEELWLEFSTKPGWIETGIIAGEGYDCCVARRFYAQESPGGRFIYYESPEGAPAGVNTYSIIQDDGKNGVWNVWWGCGPGVYNCWNKVASFGGGLPVYANELEAGLEVSSNIEPEAAGADEVARGNPSWLPWTGAGYFVNELAFNWFINPASPGPGNIQWGTKPGANNYTTLSAPKSFAGLPVEVTTEEGTALQPTLAPHPRGRTISPGKYRVTARYTGTNAIKWEYVGNTPPNVQALEHGEP
jgi:hypothetical protein